MTQSELARLVAQEANLKDRQGAELLDVLFESISRELSVGESVNIDGLGKFYTVKIPGQSVEDPPGSGRTRITLPTIEPEFEPHAALVKQVVMEMQQHPELFAKESVDDDDDSSATETGSEEADELKPLVGESSVTIEPASPAEKPSNNERPLARASNIGFIEIGQTKIDKDILSIVPQTIAKQYSAVPLDLTEGKLKVAMINPEDFDALQVLRKETGLEIVPVLTTREDLSAVLDQYTGLQAELQEVIDSSDLGISQEDLDAAAGDEDIEDENAPTAKIVASMLKRAVKEKASDIHIEPYEKKLVVRFRLDGILVPKVELPKQVQSAVIARLKILANLKIDEQRLPQDGRFSIILDKRQIDFRFSTIPVVYGEKIVMRILDKSVGIIDLESTGLLGHGLEVLKNNMRRSHGMILVTGPTGSGKTTTLYAVLGRLMSDDVNIITLEDPVEYRIESINQSQMHAEIGYTFATGLRAVVRQDPDIVMLGEIRDQETADMAVHAALTGHIVLSTLHTNDAAGSFPRLIDMGIEPFLLTSSVHTVIAQRLARKVCQECKEEVDILKEEMGEVQEVIDAMPEEQRKEYRGKKLSFYKGKGCDACGGKGYKGRLTISEVLNVTEPIRSLVLKRSSGVEITEQAVTEGMVTMTQDGLIKAMMGLTSLEEVWRVTRE